MLQNDHQSHCLPVKQSIFISAYCLVELGTQAILDGGHPFQEKGNTEQVDLQHHQLRFINF